MMKPFKIKEKQTLYHLNKPLRARSEQAHRYLKKDFVYGNSIVI